MTTLAGDRHDEQLLANVRPPGWVNPEPAGRYNLVVIGAGAAGLVAAAGAAGLGAKVALVERNMLGGDCLNAGCVPSKALIRAARAAAEVRRAGEFGVRVPDGWRVDFPAVMERVRLVRAGLSGHDSAARFRDLGVDVFLGDAAFTGRDAVEVGGKTLRFARAVIATGASARRPPIPGLAETGYLTSENVFALTELPERLVVIGAGPVGCELAQAFAQLGAKVSLIGRHPQVLSQEEPDVADVVARSLVRDGVELHLGCEVTAVETGAAGRTLHLQSGKETRTVTASAILVGAGRTPNMAGLNLEVAGVAYDPHAGVRVDDRLRTTNRRVFAAGDVCSATKYTHAADAMARVVLRNALFGGRARWSQVLVPRCTCTNPEVAHVGLSEREARERNVAYRVFTQPLQQIDRAVLDGADDGFVRVIAGPKRGTILGATAVADRAGELIAELAVAMTGGLGLGTLADVVHPYPTRAEAVKKLGDAFNRTRLTPTVKWLFEKWLSWRRR